VRIKSVETRAIRVPLSDPYHESEAEIESFNHVITRVGTEDEVGIGEADFLSLAQQSAPTVAATVERTVADEIVGMDPFNVEGVLQRASEATSLVLSPEAAAGVSSCLDLALWDLQGNALDVPVYQLLGGRVTDSIPVSFTLSAESPGEMADAARQRVDQGYGTVVVKVGRGGLDVDEARVRQVREAVGQEVAVRVDVNGGYSDADEAIDAIERFEPYDIEYVEQPVARGKPEATKEIRRVTDTTVVADESLVTLADAFALARDDVFDVYNIKPTKCGGLHASCKIASVAESAGIPCLVGGHPQQEIARQASRHFAAARSAVNCGYANEGPGPASQSLTHHVTKDVVTYDDVAAFEGVVELPEAPGLGVEIDEDALEKYTVAGPDDGTSSNG
jgi:L-alanine-DL-glutamate epimerase-like enolase superfamily enzyme